MCCWDCISNLYVLLGSSLDFVPPAWRQPSLKLLYCWYSHLHKAIMSLIILCWTCLTILGFKNLGDAGRELNLILSLGGHGVYLHLPPCLYTIVAVTRKFTRKNILIVSSNFFITSHTLLIVFFLLLVIPIFFSKFTITYQNTSQNAQRSISQYS